MAYQQRDHQKEIMKSGKGHFEKQAGFTLIEIAFVMIIIGLLTGGGVMLMKNLTERKLRNDTIDALKEARAALTSFLVNNGRLPWADNDSDGLENSGITNGTLPYLTLQTSPTDAYKRVLRYQINADLVIDRATSCFALKAGLSAAPLVVDADGSATAFAVAVILVSAGPMDADQNANVFDAVTSGAYQGNNATGIPNYLRHPPLDTFDDLITYISPNVLYSQLCEYVDLAVNNASGATIYVYDVNRSMDAGSVADGNSGLFLILSGSRMELRSGAGGGGGLVVSTPPTPITLAGQSATVNSP